MQIGLGLPNSTADLPPGRLFVDIAGRAEERGFSVLGTIGRMAYPTHEELVVLAAAAAVTERIGLFTDVLLGPTREPVLLAKQAATLDRISNGRFVLGVGVGGREDDFTVTGMPIRGRGRRWDRDLETIHAVWRGEHLEGTDKEASPPPTNGVAVPLMFGGRSEQAVARTVKYGIGYTLGGGPAAALAGIRAQIDPAWREAGRQGSPEYRALGYYALGDDAQDAGERSLRRYYGEYGDRVWAGALRSAEAVRARIAEFESLGTDHLILFMAAPALDQVDRLADAAGL